MFNSQDRHRVGLIQIHLAVLLAGGAGLFAKFLAVSPAVLTAGRTVFGCLALLVFAVATRCDLRIRGAKDAAILILSGAVLAVHWATFFHSIQMSTVAIGLLAFSAFPLFTTLLEPFVFQEPLQRHDIASAVVVTAGLVLVTPSTDFHDALTQGVLWGLLSALTYSVLSLLSRVQAGRYPAAMVSFYQQGVAALMTLPFAIGWPGGLSLRDASLLVVLGVVFTGLAQSLVVASLRHLRARTTSIVFGLEPVYGILLAWLALHERPAGRTVLGGVLILGAVLWASWQSAIKKKQE